ncbi:Protein yellow [Orchesella cincta]|uniref:Protein yellow n=1 Tax=Orchesella cincta TaxID=48709 RepID=A0A1D2MFT9_ORCCI|nr:Protein yellow [Orchesella cincta]
MDSLFIISMLSFLNSVKPFHFHPPFQFGSNYEVYYQWKQIDYNFPNSSVRTELINNGGFIQKNCVPTGIKVFQDKVFVTTPRYSPGVPYTLNVIPYKKSYFDQIFMRNNGPKLTPFPSYEMNQVGNCTALQLVQAMELDPYNRLWIVDVGRAEIFGDPPKNFCAAKLVILDLTNGNKIERAYEFPDSVVNRDGNIIKDIQVACTTRDDCFAYVANINATERSGLVIYDYKNNDSWMAFHPSMMFDPAKQNVTIEDTSSLVPFGITALGLTPKSTNYSALYFSKIAGDHIYRLNTTTLKNGAQLKANSMLSDADVQDLGAKPSGQSDGSAMDNRGRWYFGSLPESAVYYVDTTGNPGNLTSSSTKAVGNRREMQWPDTFSFDGMGNLLFTSDRFQLVDADMINPNEVNFRLIRFKTDSVSYLSG